MLTALKTSNVATGKALADAIRATKYKGLLGDFAYDETGVGIFATSIGIIKDGKLAARQLSLPTRRGVAVGAGRRHAKESHASHFCRPVGGLSLGAVYALVAMGFSLVYRTMGLVNFAHGNVRDLGAYVASTFYLSRKLPFALAMVVAIVVTGVDRAGHRARAAAAGEQGLRPDADRHHRLRHRARRAGDHRSGAPPAGRCPRRCRPRRSTCSACGSAPTTWSSLAIAAAAMVLLMLFLQRTKRGAAMQAVAMDHEAATAVGIHVGRSNAIAFVIGAGLAALAGGLVGPLLYVSPTHGRRAGHQGLRRAPSSAASAASPAPSSAAWPSGSSTPSPPGTSRATPSSSPSSSSPAIVMVRPTGIFGERTVNRA